MVDTAKKWILDTHIRRKYQNGYDKAGIHRKILNNELYKRHRFKQCNRQELCGRRVNEFVNVNTGKDSIYTIYRCNLRACPECSQRNAHKIFMILWSYFRNFLRSEKYKKLFERGYRFSHVTLTIKKAPSMKESFDDLVSGFKRWWQSS